MQRFRGHELALGFFLGVSLFAVAAVFLSVSDIVPREICEQTGEQNKTECATYGLPFVLAWSVGKALNWIAPLLAALATVAIAYYTFSLKRATDKLFDSSSEQADIARRALISSRRAWLTIEDAKLTYRTRFLEGQVDFRLQYRVRNIGETPATSVWAKPESYFDGGVRFLDAEEAYKSRMRRHPPQIGHILFPKDDFDQTDFWTSPRDEIQGSIRIRPDTGQPDIKIIIFLAVVYRIVGDDQPHMTHRVYSMLNIPLGTILEEDQFIELPPMPFHATEVD